ncbi:MAG: cytochrome c biogenesis protein [Patescibacteria group bacterium]
MRKGKGGLVNKNLRSFYMKKYLILSIVFFLLPLAISAQTVKKKAVYFYAETCSHCKKVDEYFLANGIYDKYDIKKIEASGATEIQLLNEYFDVFGDTKPEDRGYPAIFFDDKKLVGDVSINNRFVSEMENAQGADFPTPESIRKSLGEKKDLELVQTAQAKSQKLSVPIPLLVSAAFVDASNPCALAVLILLLSTVMAAKGKNKALLAGLAFSLAIFTSYFLMGLGVYKAITVFSLPKFISLGVGILSIIIGLANLKDVFWYGKVFIMEVPLSWRPKMQEVLKKVTSPLGALGAGFVVSLFLVPCSSGPYIVILGLMAEKMNTMRTLPLLVLYNFIFILPMLIITLLMYFGSARMGKMEAWRQKNLRFLHAIAAGVMLFIGSYLIYNWI